MTAIVWFRQDLRIADNPALHEAAREGKVLPVFIQEDADRVGDTHPPGGASRWWLHRSLDALHSELGGLTCLRGDARVVLPALVRETGAKAVYWNRCYEPHAIERDSTIKADIKADGVDVRSFNASLLFEPWEVETRAGGPFKVYSPFWRALQEKTVPDPLGAPERLELASGPAGEDIADWGLLPSRPNWARGFEDVWQPGERGAMNRLESFLQEGLENYGSLRDRPDLPNVSRLSPHLHFGEISPRQIWHKTKQLDRYSSDTGKFLSEIAWREFAYHLLYHFPKMPSQNWKPDFDAYPWRDSPQDLEAWQRGKTGYPIVDAGMRELWHTGYMHNRVRMIAASFLVKHLRLHWHHGEAWFRDTLVDADLANNSAGWQWVAGSGADAAPYFRVFNPMSQGAKFDPDGAYVRKWCPELKRLATEHIHAPFLAPQEALDRAGVKLGQTYPHPIVDHPAARKAALEGYEQVKQASDSGA